MTRPRSAVIEAMEDGMDPTRHIPTFRPAHLALRFGDCWCPTCEQVISADRIAAGERCPGRAS